MSKYIPKIGDIVRYKGMKAVVVDVRNYESTGDCCYDRKYLLCKLEYLLYGKRKSCSYDEIESNGMWVDVKGTNFPDFEKIEDYPPYEITPFKAYKFRQKKAKKKTVTIYE